MREIRKSGSVEGVMGNHDSYSDSNRERLEVRAVRARTRPLKSGKARARFAREVEREA